MSDSAVEERIRQILAAVEVDARRELMRRPFDRPGAWWVGQIGGPDRRCADLCIPTAKIARWRLSVRARHGSTTWFDFAVAQLTDCVAATPNRPRLRKVLIELAGLLVAMVEHLDSGEDAYGVYPAQIEDDSP